MSAALVAAITLAAAPSRAALVSPTNLDPLNLGTRVMPDLASNFMTPDLTGQGGSAPHSIGTVVGSVWLNNGVYTYKFVVTPAEDGTQQFSTQANVYGFDPKVYPAGWSYSDAVNAGVVGDPSSAFTITWTLHNGNAMLLAWFVNAAQSSAGFWSGTHRVPLAFFFQTSYAPQLNNYNLTGTESGTALNYAPSPISIALNYVGKLRDRVSPGNVGLSPDGAPDGTLTATLGGGGGGTVIGLQLQSSGPGTWDTSGAALPYWVLGAADSLDGPLHNDPSTMAVNFAVAAGGSFQLFAADYLGIEFAPGVTLTLTVSFADGTVATATTVAGPPSSSLTLAYDGKLRDRVSPGNVGLFPDGVPDGTLTATLSASGGRTVTALRLQSSGPGTWDTGGSAQSGWVVGAARTFDGPLLNDPTTMAVNFALADGGSFQIFAADYAGIEFAPGVTLTLTAAFSDGSTATASTVATAVPPPASLTLAYNGKLADRVSPGNAGLGPDGAVDGTLTATLTASGGRTVTGLQLRSSGPGTWNTSGPAQPAWVLGAATTLGGALLNDPATMAVNFPVANGGSFVVFASDYAGIEFVPGVTLTLTATFSDGTTATGSVVAAATDPPSLALTYNGKLRDRVSPSNLGLGPDGARDGTLTATLSASGGRTVTGLQLQSSAPGVWDTSGAAQPSWVVGVATTLDAPLLNDPTTMAVNFAVADSGSFLLFASDYAGIEFASGVKLTVTATFSDGSSTTGQVIVP